MAFGKAFLLSIAAFVGLNFIFTIIYYALGSGFDTLFTTIESAPLIILYYLFGSIISTPYIILNNMIFQPLLFSFDLDIFLMWLGFLIAPIIAAILAGRFGESKGQSFGAWALTAVISTVSVIIAALLSPTTEGELITLYGLLSEQIIIFAIISLIINIVFYGFFALLLSKIEYY
ncbi:MAG: hypothetical protein ACFE9Q_01025 [Candidatus Hodarchaeota archaeon]